MEKVSDRFARRQICPIRPRFSGGYRPNNTRIFAANGIRAREAQADSLVDDILLIADDARNDWMKRNGENATGYQENGEVLRRSALRIDARKWLAGKMAPKKYGDKQQVEHSGPDGGPVTLEALIMAAHKKD